MEESSPMYSVSPAPDFEERESSPNSRRKQQHNNTRHTRSGSGHNRSSSLSSILSFLSQIGSKDSAEDDGDDEANTVVASNTSNKTTPRHATSFATQTEKRLLQAHDLTRALFSCGLPCQAGGGSGSRQVDMRLGTGSYYLPSDILEDSEVLMYCGGSQEVLEAVEMDLEGVLQQNYSLMRM